MDIKMESSICNIIRKYLNKEQIENNYREVCKNNKNDEDIVRECRERALKRIPLKEFTKFQVMYIDMYWGIDVSHIGVALIGN